jgi:hypothetical protein
MALTSFPCCWHRCDPLSNDEAGLELTPAVENPSG